MNGLEIFFKVYTSILPIVEIGILAFLLYKAHELLVLTNAVQLLKAALIVAMFCIAVWALRMTMLLWLIRTIMPALLVSFAIVFQPEVRKIFIQLGQTEWFALGSNAAKTDVEQVLVAAETLSKQRRGMLVVLLRHKEKQPDIIQSGTRLDADLSANLLVTIFGHDTPMHDGACFVQDGKVIAAGCFLPLSKTDEIKKTFGTRHRAALGMSEESHNLVVVVVSEESGAISLAHNGQLQYDVKADGKLSADLAKFLDPKEDVKRREKSDESKAVS